MTQGARTELQRIALIAAAFAIAGVLVGKVLPLLLAGLVGYLLWSLFQARELLRWFAQEDNSYPPVFSGLWAEISDYVYRQRQKLRTSEANRRALAERIIRLTAALDEGMVTLAADGALEWYNPAAASLLKLRKEDRGQPITNLVREPVFRRFIRAQEFDHTLELRTHDERTTLLFSGATFGQGEIVLVIRDVTRLRQLENMRKDFVANISHELRTPLTVLSGYLETLQDSGGDLAPVWQRALRSMTQQTQRMNTLSNDLLMLSRMESLDARPQKQPVVLEPMLRGIVADTAGIAGDAFHFTLQCPAGLALLGDPTELTSVFSNLMVNAVRHNPQGVRVEITVELDDASLRVAIADNGVGIEPKHLPRLTERFYRAESSRSSDTGGTGLGLAIVKHALNRHEARLEIQSTLGKGSRFTCHFPLKRVTSASASELPAARE